MFDLRWLEQLFRREDGASSVSSFIRAGNSQWEYVRALFCISACSASGGRMTVRVETFVFGSETVSAPLIRVVCFAILSAPVSGFNSSHCRAGISPRRSPVDRSKQLIPPEYRRRYGAEDFQLM